MTRLRLEYVDPSTLGENPLNWRRHPRAQGETFAELWGEGGPGWADAVLWNETTNRLIDGHGRRLFALEQGIAEIPVLIGGWSEAQERKILATKDLMGTMAQLDAAAFDALLGELDVTGGPLLDLLAGAASNLGMYEAGGDEADGDGGDEAPGPEEEDQGPEVEPSGGVPDALYPSDNAWGIPTLDPRFQADSVELPSVTWGSVGRLRKIRGTVHFYTDDRRFEGLWKDPLPVVQAGAPSAIEPNFSTHDQMPPALALWQVYRKRWIARWWQTKGIRIFADLNVHPRFRDLNFLGLPPGWRSFATRSHRDFPEGIAADFQAAAAWAGTDQLVFAVVGGGKAVEAQCAARGWFWVPENSDTARGKFTTQAGIEGQS